MVDVSSWHRICVFDYRCFPRRANNQPLRPLPPVQVSISVEEIEDAPVANDGSHTTAEDTPLVDISFGATDPDDPVNALTYTVVSGPSNGVLSFNDPDTRPGTVSTHFFCRSRDRHSSLTPRLLPPPPFNCFVTTSDLFTYTPNADFVGSDSFEYEVSDASSTSATTATISITVTAVNDAPRFQIPMGMEGVGGLCFVNSATGTGISRSLIGRCAGMDLARDGRLTTAGGPSVDAPVVT